MRTAIPPTLAAILVALLGINVSGAAASAPCNDTWTASGSGDWDTAGNWSAGVPTSASEVCIEKAVTVTISDGDVGSVPLTSLDIAGNSNVAATLVVSIHDVVNSGSTTIGPDSSLTLNGTYNGANAGNASLGGGNVDNQGTITMEGSGYSATLWGTVTNEGTLNVPYGSVVLGNGGNGGYGSFNNEGTINIAAPNSTYSNDPAGITVGGIPFTNTSGTIANNGSFYVGGTAFGANSTYIQGNGTTSGNAIQTGQNAVLAYTGTGASSVEVHSGLNMTGNLAAGQNLQIDIGTTVTEPGSFSSAGTVTLNPSYYGGGGGSAVITAGSGTFNNTGTILAESNSNNPALSGNVVNNGVVEITPNTTLEQLSGNFTNGATGTIEPEISSTQLSNIQFDSGSTFTPGGTLAPQLEGGFVPTTGQEFDVITSRGGTWSGKFASISGNWHGDYANSGYIGAVYGPAATTTTSSAKPAVKSVAGGAGSTTTKLSCAGTKACAYKITGTVTEHLRGSKVVSLLAHSKTKTKVVTVTSARGSVAAGKSVSIRLSLNATGKALLKRFGKLRVAVTVSAGGKTVKRITVTVTKPKAKKTKK